MNSTENRIVILGITGASGAVLGQTALSLLAADARVARIHLVVTDAGRTLLEQELGIAAPPAELPSRLLAQNGDKKNGDGLARLAKKIEVLPNADVGASIASGSYGADAMCVIPCSMGMLSSVASGASNDLLSRAADVMLKEGRRLILCVRDTPLNRIHLENMLRAQQAGAVIMPASPAYYHQPRTIDDLVTQYVCRVLAQMGLPQAKQFSWKGRRGEDSRRIKSA